MLLSQVAREVLRLEPADAIEMAQRGTLAGAFKLGKHWYISLPVMIAAMQREPDDDRDPVGGFLSGGRSRRR
jgi:hypothetical protein